MFVSGSASRVWKPDSASAQCDACGCGFSFTVRRHHCRACGGIFCGGCSSQQRPLPVHQIVQRPGSAPSLSFAPFEWVRVCTACAQVHDQAAPQQPMGMGVGFSGQQPPAAAPQPAPASGVPDQGPPPPPTAFEQPLPSLQPPRAVAFNPLAAAFGSLGAVLSHQNDPHLSREDNAAQLAQRVQSASGVNAGEQYIGQAIQALEAHHLPAGVRGFVVIEPPAPGTLAAGIGLQPYDLIFEAEGLPLVDAATGLPSVTEFARIKTASWEERGMCELRVYSFTTRSYRRVHFGMPPGKPTAILGASIRPIPYVLEHVQSLAQAGSSGSSAGQEELFVKGWRKSGMMYISCTPNHYPLHGVLTPENADIYVKVWRKSGFGMTSTGEYAPLYNYSALSEPLYVETWRRVGSMMVQAGNKYAMLPMTRDHGGATVFASS